MPALACACLPASSLLFRSTWLRLLPLPLLRPAILGQLRLSVAQTPTSLPGNPPQLNRGRMQSLCVHPAYRRVLQTEANWTLLSKPTWSSNWPCSRGGTATSPRKLCWNRLDSAAPSPNKLLCPSTSPVGDITISDPKMLLQHCSGSDSFIYMQLGAMFIFPTTTSVVIGNQSLASGPFSLTA